MGVVGVLLVAVDLVGVEPPLLARLGLPHGEEAVDVGVQQEHERVLERVWGLKMLPDPKYTWAESWADSSCWRNVVHCWAWAMPSVEETMAASEGTGGAPGAQPRVISTGGRVNGPPNVGRAPAAFPPLCSGARVPATVPLAVPKAASVIRSTTPPWPSSAARGSCVQSQ